MLRVDAIDVAYGHAQVLHRVSLGVEPGEMVFVVGRNGAGKTTLLKTLAGFLSPVRGAIDFDGRQVQGMTAEALARQGMRFVNQDKKVFADLTVKDNMELAAYACGESLDQAVERLVGMYPKFAGFLEHKRVAIMLRHITFFRRGERIGLLFFERETVFAGRHAQAFDPVRHPRRVKSIKCAVMIKG